MLLVTRWWILTVFYSWKRYFRPSGAINISQSRLVCISPTPLLLAMGPLSARPFILHVGSSKRKRPCRFGLDTFGDLELLSVSWLQSKDRLLDTQGKRQNRLRSENCLFCEACFTQNTLRRFLGPPSLCGHSWLRTRTATWPQPPCAS